MSNKLYVVEIQPECYLCEEARWKESELAGATRYPSKQKAKQRLRTINNQFELDVGAGFKLKDYKILEVEK